MPSIPLGLSDWGSAEQNVPKLKMHNMYASQNPSSPDEFSRISRPTLSLEQSIGPGPITQMWSQEGAIGEATLVVSGTSIYKTDFVTAPILVGSLPGTDLPQFSEAYGTIFVIRGGLLYRTDGATVTAVSVPDGQLVSSLASLNGYLLLSIKDSQKFYWIEPGDVTIDPLNFASAERNPDYIIAIKVISDEVWFVGRSGPEVWSATGDLAAPFQRINGRVYSEGCHGRDTVATTSVKGLPALLWVTDTKAVVMAQGVPSRVSNESVEEVLKTSDNLSSWVFRYSRHDFYVINSDLFTLVLDMTTGLWSQWSTYMTPYWVAQNGLQVGSTIRAGDISSNKIYILEEGLGDDTLPVIREVSGFLPNTGKTAPCNEVIAYVNTGWSPSYTLNPVLEMRWSDDLGTTWSDYYPASIGERGEYARTVSYRSLGLIKIPGRVFEFRMSDFTRFRLDFCMMNERI